MSMTTAPAPSLDEGVEVLGLDEAATMAFLVERRRRADRAAAEELAAVCHWADLHPAELFRAVDPQIERQIESAARVRPELGVEGELRLAGQGALAVCEFAVAEVAAALGMSEPAARGYVGQALELRDRLPRLWAKVMDGELPAWKGRQVAEQTIPLSPEAAGWVDAQLACFAHRISLTRVLRAVEAAVLRFDPDLAAAKAAAAAERRGVWSEDHLDGTTQITAVTGTPDAVAFDAALNTVAATLRALGDGDCHDVRRAKAIGVLADPQYALDLTATSTASGDRPIPRPSQGPTIHVHLHESAVTGTGTGVARVVGHGARSTAAVEQWLADLAPGATVKVTPVVDLTTGISVDAYEIPDRLRAQVEERETCCVFPWCGRTGRFDLDHIEPFRHRDDGGPPGQTRTDNLARLCRFHHRIKTRGDWHYRRHPDGSYHWTSPLGRAYTVDHTGTTAHR
jgi:hypothetical protein